MSKSHRLILFWWNPLLGYWRRGAGDLDFKSSWRPSSVTLSSFDWCWPILVEYAVPKYFVASSQNVPAPGPYHQRCKLPIVAWLGVSVGHGSLRKTNKSVLASILVDYDTLILCLCGNKVVVYADKNMQHRLIPFLFGCAFLMLLNASNVQTFISSLHFLYVLFFTNKALLSLSTTLPLDSLVQVP